MEELRKEGSPAEEDRREFLKACGRFAAVTPPAVTMDYGNFDDYWAPIGAGEGPLGKYVATLDAEERARTGAAVRDAYEAGRPDGPRSFANVAWVCRGTVP